MSNTPDNDMFSLDNLFTPAWAKQPETANRYAKYEGREDYSDRGDRRGGRPGGGGGFGGPRREGGGGQRPARGPGGSGGAGGARFGGPRPGGDRRPGGPGGSRPGDRRDERSAPREPLPPPEVMVTLVPDATGVEMLSRQIKMTGRAYPLFQIALMILEKPERHSATFTAKKGADGKAIQPLFACALDETLWLSADEVVAHILQHHLGTFYQADRTQTEPPKGKYTFVAQCGISGVILGPPNHHDYQSKLHALHAERFARMPFDMFKARVKIVKDEAVVAKWVEEQSWKTEYVCLNIPDAPKLATLEDVENHFRAVHQANIVKPVETITISGKTARSLRSQGLVRLYRMAVEDQRRFPLQIATVLSQQFAQHGLQFFKVNKTLTHVWIARPKYLDLETTPVSNGVKRIIDVINSQKKCTRVSLVEAIAPTPAAAPIAVPPPTAEDAPATVAKPEPAGPTPEQSAVIADLHWLIHQGHVIEFATTGLLETAKKPLPKPPKPAPKKAPAPTPAEAAATPAAVESAEARPEEDAMPTAAEAQAVGDATVAAEQAAPASEAAPQA